MNPLNPESLVEDRESIQSDRFVEVNYDDRIPNNVDLSSDRRLQRALESWQPNYVDWWKERGPDGFQNAEVYLRTAVGVDPAGWAKFGYVRMPDYRWGILLAPQVEGRTIAHGKHKGQPAWQEVPGEYRALLKRLIVVQGDTELPNRDSSCDPVTRAAGCGCVTEFAGPMEVGWRPGTTRRRRPRRTIFSGAVNAQQYSATFKDHSHAAKVGFWVPSRRKKGGEKGV